MVNIINILHILIAFICIFPFYPSKAYGSGFGLFMNGAGELGMMNAVISHSQGPASNFFNPALIAFLDGTLVEISSTMVMPSIEFQSDLSGKKTNNIRHTNYPSALFFTHKTGESFTLGLGVNNTFGLCTKWPVDWEGRYIITTSELMTFNINPNLAWKVTDKISMAVGADVLLGDASMEQNLNLSLFGLPDGRQKFRGDGEGYGYNLGALYKVTDEVSLGLSWRSSINLHLKGDVKFDLPKALSPILAQTFPDTDGETTLDLPPQLHCGLSYRPLDNIIFEVGGRWEGWSSYDQLKIKFDGNVAGQGSVVTLKNWKDTYQFIVGVKYNAEPTLALLAGYARGEDPVPDNTFEPSIPVSSCNNFSIGVQKVWAKFSCAVCYLYNTYHSRDKNNDIGALSGLTANGRYKADVNIVGVSVAYMFK